MKRLGRDRGTQGGLGGALCSGGRHPGDGLQWAVLSDCCGRNDVATVKERVGAGRNLHKEGLQRFVAGMDHASVVGLQGVK